YVMVPTNMYYENHGYEPMVTQYN
nr:alpha-1,4-glucan lyase=111 kda starch/glycogen-degrading enzyme {internal fragment 1} [Gracilariopsis lemaneiformis=red algae, (Bory) Dawson, Acleto et Foldvik, Peptide Chloroplast Partial, 23 aa] [Gracilariopsis lemaneiformis]